MKRTPLAALALVAALVTVLGTACDDEVEPDFAPPESTSPAPTDPTTSTTPEPEKLSPEETVRAWVDARNVALETGDTSGMRELSAKECSSCTEQMKPIEKVYAEGGHFETDGWRVRASKIKSRSGKTATVSAALVLAAGRTVPKKGAEPISYPEEKRIAIFELANSDGRWTVTLIGFIR